MSDGTRIYRLTVDGKGVTLLVPASTTLDEVWESARARFGADRVTDVFVEPVSERQTSVVEFKR